MSLLIFTIISFLSGSLIKLTDDLADKNMAIHPVYSILTGLAYGSLMGYLMIIDTGSSVLFGGIVLGCLITGKINTPGHYFGLSGILIMIFLYGIKISPHVLFTAALAAFDELKDINHIPGYLYFIFDYRLILKTGILVLVIFNILEIDTLIILLGFDIAYMITDNLTSRIKQ